MTRSTCANIGITLLSVAALLAIDEPTAALLVLAWSCLVEAFFAWATKRKAELRADIERLQRAEADAADLCPVCEQTLRDHHRCPDDVT